MSPPTYTCSFPLFSVALLDPVFNAQQNIMETGNMLVRAAQRQKMSEWRQDVSIPKTLKIDVVNCLKYAKTLF